MQGVKRRCIESEHERRWVELQDCKNTYVAHGDPLEACPE
jgi:hypothetical protein